MKLFKRSWLNHKSYWMSFQLCQINTSICIFPIYFWERWVLLLSRWLNFHFEWTQICSLSWRGCFKKPEYFEAYTSITSRIWLLETGRSFQKPGTPSRLPTYLQYAPLRVVLIRVVFLTCHVSPSLHSCHPAIARKLMWVRNEYLLLSYMGY